MGHDVTCVYILSKHNDTVTVSPSVMAAPFWLVSGDVIVHTVTIFRSRWHCCRLCDFVYFRSEIKPMLSFEIKSLLHTNIQFQQGISMEVIR